MQIFKLSLILAFLLVQGCSSEPEKPEPPPTIISAKIAVSGKANPDVSGRPSPIVIRMYELKSLGKYVEGDFYDLFENYDSSLGSDLLSSEQFHLKPGDIKTLKHEVSADTRFIAVVAAYRDIDRAVWRDSIMIPAEKTTDLFVFAEPLTVSIWKK